MDGNDTKHAGKYVLLILVVIFLLGLIVIGLNRLVWELANGWLEIIDGIAIALMTASILGLTIDRFLKKQIIEDVFSAAVGYILTPELRSEVKTLYELEFICIEHNEIFTLKPTANSSQILLHRKIERTFKNITNKKQRLPTKVTAVEWFLSNSGSKILDMGAVRGEEKWTSFTVDYPSLNKEGEAINEIVGRLKNEIELSPDETCSVWFETEELKRATDIYCEYFQWPTRNPRITVRREHGAGLEGTLGILVRFGAPRGKDVEGLGSDTTRLNGILLPGQCIEIRWWMKKDAKRWIQDAQSETK